MSKQVKVGDRVAYTRNALLTIGSGYADLRGTVLEIVEHSPGWSLATVEWERVGGRRAINVRNLCKPRSVAFVECEAARGLDL